MVIGRLQIKVKTNQKGNIQRSYTFSYTALGIYKSVPFEKIAEDQIDPELLQKTKSIQHSVTLEVELEEENNQVRKLREKGKSWITNAGKKTETEDSKPVQGKKNFHNPYNFIPALDRKTDDEKLGDCPKPVGHGCYHLDRWTGRIAVKLTTVTPLLIPDASEMSHDEESQHSTYPLRLGVDGKPYLPPTSLKGMLRSAYEAVTNSRLSVFFKHDRRLAYRMSAKRGTISKPARVEKRGDRLYLRILEDSSCVGGAAKLPRYDKKGRAPDKGERRKALKYRSTNQLPQHGDPVCVQLSKGKVTQIEPWDSTNLPGGNWKRGWACVTGANIGGKEYERVFIDNGDDRVIEVNKNMITLWEDLITDYQKIHEKELQERKKKGKSPSDYLGQEPGQTAWSHHIRDKSAVEFKEGTLCYVELEDDADLQTLHSSDIVALQPVTISRRLYDTEPEKLLPKSLHPAQTKQELSPADRVFGWVNQNGQGSYKGNLRVHSVECQTSKSQAISEFGDLGVPLAILGEPKPAQTRFYCAEDKEGTPIKQGQSKEHGYSGKKRGLRGRKAYPHHRDLPDGYWKKPTRDRTEVEMNGHYQEYRRPKGEKERDSQNRSITAWVNPGTEFAFDIDVTNLSDVELGALLWLLSLPDHHYHRLGGGKPLGFGSVKVQINENSTDLRLGEDWKQFYRTLQITEGDKKQDYLNCVAKYKQATQELYGKGKSFESISFISAFCTAAAGFDDGHPIHYPRIDQKIDPDGKNYEWFTNNEGGDQWSLPSLERDHGLPLKSRSQGKQSQGRGQQSRSPAMERPT
jgi:CRISPR-associated protein (TIGR03986 family)